MSPVEIYTKEERKINGVFYTPLFLAEYLSKKVHQYFGYQRKISSVIDPACGDSILLRSFGSEFLEKIFKVPPKIIGIDKDINAIASSTSEFANKKIQEF